MTETASDMSLWPLLIYFITVVALVASMPLISSLLGQRRREQATNEPYESGIVPVGDTGLRFSVEFYLIAIFFVIFDLETVFIFAWAVAFNELAWAGFIAVSVFIIILLVALVYEWKTGALDWGVKKRTAKITSKRPEGV